MNTIAIADTHLPTRFPPRMKYARMHLEFESGAEKMTPEEFWDFCTENVPLPGGEQHRGQTRSSPSETLSATI